MPYHDWSEKDFDWNGLDQAGHLIYKICKLGRIYINWKEKYGTLRTSTHLYTGSLHSLIYPGYVYRQFPQWLWTFDIYCITPFMEWTRIPKLVQKIQLNIFYRLAYYVAMKKYPHLKEEIAVDADYPEYIIGGMEIHDKYWKKA
jgi:hypothetical protein